MNQRSPFSSSIIRFWVSMGVLASLLSGCASRKHDEAEALPHLMTDRLAWMDEVALVKKAKRLPVEDPVREAQLLDAMVKEGQNAGLPAKAVRAFFQGQIQAAKVCQMEWLARHAEDALPAPHKLPDLTATVRPALDHLGREMIVALAEARRAGKHAAVTTEAAARMREAGYSQAVMEAALKGLDSALW